MNREPPARSLLGRSVVYVLFGAFVLYGAGAIIGSMLVSLYGTPPPRPETELTQKQRAWCLRTAVGLRDELEGQVSLELQHPRKEAPLARWQTFEATWLERLRDATARCTATGDDAMEAAYGELRAMHSSYDGAVAAMTEGRHSVSGRFGKAVQALKQQLLEAR